MAKYETGMLQNSEELNSFIGILQRENVRSYLEIGSKHGGSLWCIANNLPAGSRIVAVDLPHGDESFKESQPHLEECVAELKARGYDAHLFLGDSTSPEIVEQVKALGPFDATFVDANHTRKYVEADWSNYSPMTTKIMAFHDIGWVPRDEPSKKMPIEVPIFWNEIKGKYRHEEIKLEPSGRDNGIGVLWRS